MDIALRNALDGLRKAGAMDLPDAQTIESARGGTSWAGKKRNEGQWYLIKHKAESYNAEF